MSQTDIETEVKAPSLIGKKRPSSRKEIFQRIWPPIFSFILLLIVWQVLVVGFEVPEYIMPPPSDFLARLVESRSLLFDHMLRTATEVALGFLLATAISVPLGYLIASVNFVERSVYPLIVFVQLTPKIAIAPLFIVWFGFGMTPKIFITFLLCFFPTLVASMAGFKSLDERILFLSRSMGATPKQTFRYIQLPTAMPYIFAGLRVSIVFAATGAIVGEFVGANKGLGYLLLRGSAYLDTALIFAVLIVLALMGLFFSYAVQFTEQIFMPWKRKGGK
ncbi:MAG TPA: ABC transporter permease [candidate division Zixibacteria bacterium]|nr:ABC transporter permease [candidate division Zixibacteria bacterium]